VRYLFCLESWPILFVKPPAGYEIVNIIEVVFQCLEAQEADAKKRGHSQKQQQAAVLTKLCIVDREHHGQAADEQDNRVEPADLPVQLGAGCLESFWIKSAVDRQPHK